ncbi:serine/threonine-protein kinase [Spirillospora albida]|uniref:serine/threonine-protein kinase n=1 Tax=Spirillospora albida TaxID=58123 RepID=UPI00068AF88E|nr:serine/threonine-protein kinase [Spirillospora albida]
MEALRPGDPREIGGHRITARLGSGGMGRVFLARSPAGRSVAVKVVHPELAGDPGFRARFAREVAAARAVGGAFTAPLIDADADAHRPWLVTAYLPGRSLTEAVAAHGPLPPPSVRALGAGLAEALTGIHRAGVVHRDLKPSNVLLTPDGARVIDFGIARAADAATVTRTGTAIGSPGYLPPEQAAGGTTGPAGDVFSLGAVLVFAATGEGPFGDGAVHELVYRVLHEPPRLDGVTDPELRALIAGCLEKDPERRPAPDALLERLAALAPAPPHGVDWLPPPVATDITRPVPVPPPTQEPAKRAVPSPARRRLLVGAAATGAVLLTGGTAVAAVRSVLRAVGPAEGTWTFTPEQDNPTGGPLVLGDLLLVTAGIGDDVLIAIDRRTGKPRWTADGVKAPRAGTILGAVSAGNILYTYGRDEILALNRADGRRLWRADTDTFGTDTGPVAGGGVVVATVRRPEMQLRGHDAVSGRQRWTFRLESAFSVAAAVAGPMVYAVTSRGDVFGIEAATGQAKWRRALRPGGLSSSAAPVPVAAGGLLYLVDEGVTHALDAATGAPKWKSAAADAASTLPNSAVAVAGDAVYTAHSTRVLEVFGAADGKKRWQHTFPPGDDRNAFWMLPVVAEGTAVSYVNETLVALDAASGRERWRKGGLPGIFQRPVAASGAVHLANLQDVVSFDLATGRELQRIDGQGNQPHNVAVADGFLYWYEGFGGVRAAEAPR